MCSTFTLNISLEHMQKVKEFLSFFDSYNTYYAKDLHTSKLLYQQVLALRIVLIVTSIHI